MAGNQHVIKSEHTFSEWLATSTFRIANMRSLNGWQPARFELRTCVVLMAGNQHVCHFCALHSMRKVPKCQPFGASIASDSTSCSSSFCTFSLSTRHFSRWIPCICQHLKIVWESSKTDPFSLGKIIRHTFALALAPKVKKCDYFGGSSIPSPPWINVGSCDYDRIYASVST